MSVGRFAGNAFEGLQLPTVTDFMNPKEDYGKTATRGIAERGATDATSMTEIAKIHSAGIGKGAAIESAKHLGEARRYAGQQAGNAAIFGGIASGIGSLGAGAIKGAKYSNGSLGGKQYSSYGIDFNSGTPFSRDPLSGLSFSSTRLVP